jgi:hypothetical protein
MPLLQLPFELLHTIAENLKSERDISSFSQTNTYLHHALSSYLYENNVKQHGGSALIWAAEHGHEEVVRKLLNKTADVNAQTLTWLELIARNRRWGGEYGSALQAASAGGHEKVVQMLCDAGAERSTYEQ